MVGGVEPSRPGHLDTLCCGTLGGIELLREAGTIWRRDDLCNLASRRPTTVVEPRPPPATTDGTRADASISDRSEGLAGVGNASQEIDPALPNVLIWE